MMDISKIISVTHNAVKREIKELYPNLDITFVPYTTYGAIDLKKINAELIGNKLKPPFIEKLEGIKSTTHLPHPFIGLASEHKKSFIPLSFMKKRRTLAVFLYDATHIEDETQARLNAWHLAWHAIRAHKLYNNIPDFYGGYETPHEIAKQNALADSFASTIYELSSQSGSIGALARARSLMTVQPYTGFKAEQYPFPIIAEHTDIVLRDFKSFDDKSTKSIIEKAVEITNETATTLTDDMIEQWQGFAKLSQEMAWVNTDINKNTILQAAMYSSEDPYIRSIAYVVSDLLNIDPVPNALNGILNAFSPIEANFRMHEKLCGEIFDDLTFMFHPDNTPESDVENKQRLWDIAIRQNERLKQGHVIGWCAQALLATQAMTIQSNKTEPPTSLKRADIKTFFEDQMTKTSLVALKALGEEIFMHKRLHGPESSRDIRALCEAVVSNKPDITMENYQYLLGTLEKVVGPVGLEPTTNPL